MMDRSSIIGASLVFAGVIAVVMMGIAMLPSESTTVSTHSRWTGSQSEHTEHQEPVIENVEEDDSRTDVFSVEKTVWKDHATMSI